MININDFGIDATGGKDSSAGIQSAINALKGNGVLEFPPGAFLISINPLSINGNIKIKGSGKGITVLKTPPLITATYTLFFVNNGAQLDVSDLTILGPTDPGKFTQNGSATDLFITNQSYAFYCDTVSTGKTGRLTLNNVEISGAFAPSLYVINGPVGDYNGQFSLELYNCELSNFIQGIGLYAAASSPKKLIINNSTIKNPYQNGKFRGHMIYLHPHVNYNISDSNFEGQINPADYVIQHYSSSDFGDISPGLSKIARCNLSGMNRGILSTNKGPTQASDCVFNTITIGFHARHNTDIDNSTFYNLGVSTYPQGINPESVINVYNSTFNTLGANDSIDVTAVSKEQWSIDSCDFIWDSQSTGKAINQGYIGGGLNQGTLSVTSCRFFGPTTAFPDFAVCVSADYGISKTIKDCEFYGNVFACIQVVNGTNTSPDTVGIFNNRFLSSNGYGIRSASGGQSTPLGVIYGENNLFGSGLISEMGEEFSAIIPRNAININTLNSADKITLGMNYNTHYIAGNIPINTMNLNTASNTCGIGFVSLISQGGLTFGSGGNIIAKTNDVSPSGVQRRMFYNPQIGIWTEV